MFCVVLEGSMGGSLFFLPTTTVYPPNLQRFSSRSLRILLRLFSSAVCVCVWGGGGGGGGWGNSAGKEGYRGHERFVFLRIQHLV